MISIGIVSISIFGLLALLPVAGQQAERGLINDRAAVAGRNAVAEFHAREMARLEVEQLPGGGTNVIAAHWCNGGSAGKFTLTPGLSYCIDPMYVTRRVDEGSFGAPNTGFPDVAGVNQMQRVNLRSSEWPYRQLTVPNFTPHFPAVAPWGHFEPNGSYNVPGTVPVVPNAGGLPLAMTQPMADYIFTAPDDIVFDKNEDQATPGNPAAPLLPIQQMSSEGVRQTEAAFNWMATLVPEPQQDSTSYLLSIVVFHDRPLAAGQERVAQIASADFFSQGLGGGDVRITPRPGQPLSDVMVRRGQWVLLAPTTNVSYFRWYRVIEADYESDGVGLHVTLDGEDWPLAPPWTGAPAGFAAPFVIIPPNVVAVFQRTLRFQETTAWFE